MFHEQEYGLVVSVQTVAHVEVPVGNQGFGLTSMRERVQALGGQFVVETGRGGTCVEAWVPGEARP